MPASPTAPLVFWPDQTLRQPAQAVQSFDAKLRQLVDLLFTTMRASEGIGLAAPQIGVLQQVAVINIPDQPECPLVLVNPEVEVLNPELVPSEEGCLSIPGVRAQVKRPQRVALRAQDADGKAYSLEASELFGVCIQHECDHLHGRLYFDHISPLKRELLLKRYRKLRAQA